MLYALCKGPADRALLDLGKRTLDPQRHTPDRMSCSVGSMASRFSWQSSRPNTFSGALQNHTQMWPGRSWRS